MYTEEQTRLMRNAYQAAENEQDRITCVKNLAERFEKPEASIRGKLSKEGVYIPKVRVSKITKSKPKTKAQIVDEIGYEIGQDMAGLEKAPKLVLLKLLDIIMKKI